MIPIIYSSEATQNGGTVAGSRLRIVHADGRRSPTLDTNIDQEVCIFGYPSQQSIDFFFLASSIYVADKFFLRRHSFDYWTRNLQLTHPVAITSDWNKLKDRLELALNFLTGDNWRLRFRKHLTHLSTRTYGIGLGNFDAVSLFSGGLDSLAGAINLLEDGKRVLLVGHYDAPHTAHDQAVVANSIKMYYGRDRLALMQVRLRPASRLANSLSRRDGFERTTRSRSIVFLALGYLFASLLSPTTPIYLPENGFLSLNIPLNNSRVGSCSTRTTHPFFLTLIEELLAGLGISNPLITPFRWKTKGEVLQGCANIHILEKVARLSVSCAHPEALRWVSKPYGHCGYCYPCIVRRAGMYRMGWDRVRDYAFDVRNDRSIILSPERGKDSRAVLRALDNNKSIRTADAVLRSGPIHDYGKNGNLARGVYKRGLTEIATFFASA